ncbi:hypothetical protein X798_05715, partial [Onchocerca flexuosa]
MKQVDIYKSSTTNKADYGQHSRRQLAKSPTRSTERSVTLQQTILLTIIYYIEDWCQYLLWITLLYVIGIRDRESFLRNRRMKCDQKRNKKQHLGQLKRNGLPRVCTKDCIDHYGLQSMHSTLSIDHNNANSIVLTDPLKCTLS